MNLKQVLWTVVIAAGVSVAYDAYKAKRGA